MGNQEPLYFQIATGDTRPIVRQIIEAVKLKIANQTLTAGAQLPSVRGLAQQLGINPNTVAKAYAELTTEGWVEARPGLGLFVRATMTRLSEEERERRLQVALTEFVGEIIGLGFSQKEIIERVEQSLHATQIQTLTKAKKGDQNE